MRKIRLDQTTATLKASGAYMPKADKARWIRALRSGKYKQGKSYLYCTVEDRERDPSVVRPDTYCCIGVDCVLQGAKLDQWSRTQRKVAIPGGKYRRPGLALREHMYHLPAYLMLADLNDCGATFNQIADVIKAGVKGV